VKPPEQPKPTPAQVKPAPTPEKQPERAPPQRTEPSRDQVLAKALDAARQDVAKRSTNELEQALAALRQETAAPSGGADGSPEGVSVGGLVEVYAQMVESRIKANWRFPHMGSRPDLIAVVEVQLAADGRILGSKVIRSSGRPDFDASTERAIEETGQLPAPPRADLRTLRITFNLQEL
jgi:colicin import membrane protein